MKITSVGVSDFMAISNASFNLADQGLVLLAGENQDDSSASSNGAGKSSLMDAVSWAIWGVTARGVAGNDVIRNGAKQATALVRLVEDENGYYEITRERTKGKGALSLSYTDTSTVGLFKSTSLTGGTEKLTQDAIERILGCTQEVFASAVYIGQESLPDLPAMTDKKLKELIEEAAGLRVLEAAYTKAREKARDAALLVSGKVMERNRLVTDLANIDERVARETALHTDWELEQRQHRDRAIETIDNHLKLIDAATDERESSSAVALLRGRIGQIDAELAGLAAEQTRNNELNRAAFIAVNEITNCESNIKALADRLRSELEASKVVHGLIGMPCKECGTPLTEDHVHPLEESVKARALKLQTSVREAMAARDAAKARATAATAAHDAHTATLHDPAKLSAERAAIAARVARTEEINKRIALLDGVVSEKRIEIDRLAIMCSPHLAEISRLSAKRVSFEADRVRAVADLHMLEAAAQHADAVMQVFSPAGVRAHILDEVTPALNERTGAYLSALTDGAIIAIWSTLSRTAKGELRERFAIDVKHMVNGQGFASLSGGEKRKVRLACALALQDLVASRASKPLSLWVADEVDTALDTAGLERLMMVLHEKARERGTVVVVSHQSLKDWIPTVWTITKQDGKATLAV